MSLISAFAEPLANATAAAAPAIAAAAKAVANATLNATVAVAKEVTKEATKKPKIVGLENIVIDWWVGRGGRLCRCIGWGGGVGGLVSHRRLLCTPPPVSEIPTYLALSQQQKQPRTHQNCCFIPQSHSPTHTTTPHRQGGVVIATLFIALIIMGFDWIGPDLVFGGLASIYMVSGESSF